MPPPDGGLQPVFFLGGPAAALLVHRTESTDLFVDSDELLAQLLEATELAHLLLGLAQSGGVGKTFRDRPASYPAGQPELGVMAGVVGPGAQSQVGLPQRRTTAVTEPGRKSPKLRNSSRD